MKYDLSTLTKMIERRAAILTLEPKYEYDQPLRPVWPQMIAEAIGKIDTAIANYQETGNFGWAVSHTTTGLRSSIDYTTTAGKRSREVRAIREARKERRQYSPTRLRAGMALHVKISDRQPGTFLARQKQIEYAILLHAHRSPGLSMTDNLRRSNHPTCTRLANA